MTKMWKWRHEELLNTLKTLKDPTVQNMSHFKLEGARESAYLRQVNF